MARSINRVELIGNVGNDPNVSYTNAGQAVARISVATTERFKDKQTGDPQEKTEWHRVVFFGKAAEIVEKYVNKGSMIRVEGKLRTEKYTGKDGIERYSTDIVGNDLMLLGGRREGASNDDGQYEQRPRQQGGQARGNGGGGRQQERQHYDRSPAPQFAENSFADDDIPF